MSPYDMIKDHLSKSVPFAAHTGVVLESVADGEGVARLEQSETSINHIASQHAGALFTLGETASGAALAGALAPVIMSARPVAAKAEIAYKKIAKGAITAHAKASQASNELLQTLEKDGRVSFDVHVDLQNADGESVAAMTVQWHVSKARDA
ncbi:MAG: YiiD C-terminal domain-containing protein [Pseudomonadota bacterium]